MTDAELESRVEALAAGLVDRALTETQDTGVTYAAFLVALARMTVVVGMSPAAVHAAFDAQHARGLAAQAALGRAASGGGMVN